MKGQQTQEEKAMNQEEIRIVKIATCPSLSGRSTLEYSLSCTADNAVSLGITRNSGNGVFNKRPILLTEIIASLNKEPITANTLNPLFKGVSTNNISFFLSILLSEGLLKIDDEVKRTYKRVDPAGYMKGIAELVESGISLDLEKTEVPPEKKGKKGVKKPKGEAHED